VINIATEVFKLMGSILVDSSKAEKSISATSTKTETLSTKLGNGIKTAGKWAVGLGVAAAAVGTAMYGVATKAAKATDTIDKMSQKIGISREAYQEWDFILSQNGTSIDKMQTGMKTLVSRMDEAAKGTGTGAEAFKKLKLDAIDPLTGSLKSQEQMFEETVIKLQEMPDGAEKARLAVELFGKAGTELMPLLNGAGGSVEELKQKAQDLGIVLSDEAINAGVNFTDTMDQLKRSFSAVGTSLGASLMPMFISLAEWIMAHMPEIQATIKVVFDNIKIFIEGLQAFWAEHGEQISAAVSAVWDVIKFVVENAMQIIRGIILVVTGLIEGDWSLVWDGLKLILEGAFKLIQGALQLALDDLVAIVTGIGGALKDAGKAIFQKLWDGLKEKWDKIKSWFGDVATKIKDTLFFWQDSEEEVAEKSSKSGKTSGSHAAGLAYVPYDGYIAELHRGERVLTAQDNSNLAAQIVNGLSAVLNTKQSSGNQTFIFKVGEKEIARATYGAFQDESKRRGEAWGV